MKRLLLIIFFICSFMSDNNVESQDSKNKYVSTKAGLRLRTNPDKSSKVITLLKFGEKVSILDEEGSEIFMDGAYGKWVNVQTGEMNGWVFSGFLCDFKPDTVIKQVGDYYRKIYSKDKFFSQHKEYTQFRDNQISIETIKDNYIIINVPMTSEDSIDISKGNAVWKYDKNINQFSEAYNIGHANTTELLYLNDDKYLDLAVHDGCCDTEGLNVLLGSEKGFYQIYEIGGCEDIYFNFESGGCDNTTFICKKMGDDTGVANHYKFNCVNKIFELNAVGKITEANGFITKINVVTNTITFKTDNTERTFIVSKKAILGYRQKHLSDFKIGDEVTYSYETLNGKSIVVAIIQGVIR